jgi:hypothetical protein
LCVENNPDESVCGVFQIFAGSAGVSDFEHVHPSIERHGSIDYRRDRLEPSLIPLVYVYLGFVLS